MYAVIRTGGKQYRVAPGEKVKVEKLPGKVGGKVTFENVLAVHNGEKKMVAGTDAGKATVTGKIVAQGRHRKVKVMKYKTGGQYKIFTGHRQGYTEIEVGEIKI